MIDKTVNFLQDTELLKKIVPIAERMGLEADDILQHLISADQQGETILNKWILSSNDKYKDAPPLAITIDEELKTYTSSSLELLLPKWEFKYHEDKDLISFTFEGWAKIPGLKLIQQIEELIFKICNSRGKEKVEAIARLIILLEDNNLLEVKE